MQADQHVAFDRYRVELASFSCSGHTWLPSPSLATCPHSINCGLFIGDAAFSLHPIVTIPHNLLDLFSRHILENCRYLFNSAASSGIELWKPGLPVGAGLFVLAQEEIISIGSNKHRHWSHWQNVPTPYSNGKLGFATSSVTRAFYQTVSSPLLQHAGFRRVESRRAEPPCSSDKRCRQQCRHRITVALVLC